MWGDAPLPLPLSLNGLTLFLFRGLDLWTDLYCHSSSIWHVPFDDIMGSCLIGKDRYGLTFPVRGFNIFLCVGTFPVIKHWCGRPVKSTLWVCMCDLLCMFIQCGTIPIHSILVFLAFSAFLVCEFILVLSRALHIWCPSVFI